MIKLSKLWGGNLTFLTLTGQRVNESPPLKVTRYLMYDMYSKTPFKNYMWCFGTLQILKIDHSGGLVMASI
jgi:hypothetical protein